MTDPITRLAEHVERLDPDADFTGFLARLDSILNDVRNQSFAAAELRRLFPGRVVRDVKGSAA